MSQHNWLEEENQRAEQLSKTGQTTNSKAPRLVRAKSNPAPVRTKKGFFIQEKYAMAFDRLVFEQKMVKGKKGPELLEEALSMLLKKYGIKVENS